MAEKKEPKQEAAPVETALEKRDPVELALAAKAEEEEKLHKFLFYGDLSSLGLQQQNEYMFMLAKSMDLNPWTKPFDLIPNSKGKLFVYANKGCAAQLRHVRSISLETIYEGPLRLADKVNYGIYSVVVEATIPDERCAGGFRKLRNVGCVGGIDQLTGEALSNAIMKCYTKATRRVTLDICGIGFPDESELDSFNTPPRYDQPQTRAPKPLPQGAGSAGPQDLPAVATIASGETVNTKTGEIIEAVPVVAPGANAGAGEAFKPAAVANAQPSQPVKSKYPPAVPPVGVPSGR